MGAQTDARPIGAGRGIGPGLAAFYEGGDEFVDQVRVRAAMAAALNKRQMFGVVYFGGLRKATDRLRQEMCEVGDCHLFGNLWLGLFGGVNNVWFVLDERPFEAFLRAIDVKTLAVLPGRVVQEPPDVSDDIGVQELDVA